jgi:1,2-diacylglycerol 3-alpha-glucosyltransferase
MHKLAIIWTNFGPYHAARIRALTEHFEVDAIELADFERLYAWGEEKKISNATVHTLRTGALEEQNRFLVSVSLWRRLHKIRPGTVLIPGYAMFPALVAALWGTLHAATTVLMTESTARDHRRVWYQEIFKRLLIRALFRRAIGGGIRSRRYLVDLGMPPERIATGYDVVDNDFFSRGVAQVRVERGRRAPYFLYVGRLAPEKNISGLIQAFADYRGRGGHWHLVIVGDGPLDKQLRAQAEKEGCGGWINFAGRRSVVDLIPFYADAGCFILPSIREPWGLVVNEAMASGLPVIVSTCCGCSEDLVQDGVNGYLFDPGQQGALSALLSEISGLSDGDRARMTAESREIISRYSPRAWAAAVLRLLAFDCEKT